MLTLKTVPCSKGVTWKCPARVSDKGVLQECQAKCRKSMSCKSVRVSSQNLNLQECLWRVSNNIWPFVFAYVCAFKFACSVLWLVFHCFKERFLSWQSNEGHPWDICLPKPNIFLTKASLFASKNQWSQRPLMDLGFRLGACNAVAWHVHITSSTYLITFQNPKSCPDRRTTGCRREHLTSIVLGQPAQKAKQHTQCKQWRSEWGTNKVFQTTYAYKTCKYCHSDHFTT